MENLSRLDELQIKYDDPVSHFKKIAEERTFEKKAAQKISVPIDMEAEMDINEDNLKNAGYSVLKELYKQLELDKFLKKQWISCMKSGRIERIQMRMVNYGLL